ncbi:MAG TPA: metallophosphoesterase [Myxococcota bacterium]|nr:metallophosphoesterase [Myxococcota bacterium]
MRIGVVSDTHNHLRNVERIVELFHAAAVEHVIHTGDITQPKTLAALSALRVPLSGVYGNNDLEREGLEEAARRYGMTLRDPPFELVLASRRIVVVHDPRELERVATNSYDVALHGHVHRRVIERKGGRLVFNPGECAGHLRGHNAVGVVDLASLDTEVLRF